MSDARAIVERMFDQSPMGDVAGREAFKTVVGQWRSAVPDVHCEVDNVIVDGDNVAWIVRTTGEGRAVEHWAEQGMFPFLVQIGVMPAPRS